MYHEREAETLGYQRVYLTYEQARAQQLRDVQRRAALLGWSVETHRKGYFLRRGEIPGYPEDGIGFIVGSLDEASEHIEDVLACFERQGTPLTTAGKLHVARKDWRTIVIHAIVRILRGMNG